VGGVSDDSILEERDPITDEAFRVLLDWFMVADPWPLEPKQNAVMFGFLGAESSKRGYESWEEAYHEFDPDA
jgi:hypothetical protein